VTLHAPSLAIAPIDLGAPVGRSLLAALCEQHGPGIESAMRHFHRLFSLRPPEAEHLSFVGAQVEVPNSDAPASPQRLSVGATGETVEAAFQSCIGEGIELLSQFERPGDVARTGSLDEMRPSLDSITCDWIAAHEPAGGVAGPIDWVTGFDLIGGAPAFVPADLCLRRSSAKIRLAPRAPLSVGCAAGATRADALLRALLELIERDAVALWWDGGRFGRAVPVEDPAGARASALLQRVRGAGAIRRSWLLDISTGLGAPVMVSISVDSSSRGLACGFAARLDRSEAAVAATREMMQVELAYAVVAAKLAEGGEAALAPADRRHLVRARTPDLASCPLLHPQGSMEEGRDAPAASLSELLQRLAAHSVGCVGIDLGRSDLAVPVCRVVAPALQTSRESPITTRLAATIRDFGGGSRYTGNVDLF